MIYRSGLAVFLVLRITLDISTSVLSEVLWLIFSILWGTLRLVVLRSSAEGENNNWTFGQVLPLVSLAAPLVGVVEYFSPDSEISNDTSPPYSHMQNIVTEAASSGEGAMRFTEIPNETIVSTEVRDDLERDYYATAKWFKFVTVLMFCISLEIVIMNLLNIYVGNSAFPMSVMLLIALPRVAGPGFGSIVTCAGYGSV
ncbi:hypothetical protein AOQ84DRAFT_379101 [Glonium stellatum]|uniref:Uncharacterized protein n=1 Tax=Glonium stellatum TaxID=574774 RepID=A0A8E2EX18_9PEZI|nr:hypothetical protein AOQ84DRAFT_379101 [Glonium stellatum]